MYRATFKLHLIFGLFTFMSSFSTTYTFIDTLWHIFYNKSTVCNTVIYFTVCWFHFMFKLIQYSQRSPKWFMVLNKQNSYGSRLNFDNVKVITNVQTNDMWNSFPYQLSSLQGFISWKHKVSKIQTILNFPISWHVTHTSPTPHWLAGIVGYTTSIHKIATKMLHYLFWMH